MDKLQELTDKLYNEGLSKGRKEGEALLADARGKADEIVEGARKEAEAIVLQAKKEAADYKLKVEADLKMASSQVLQATKKDIEDLIVCKMTGGVKEALSSKDFLKDIIKSVAGGFGPDGAEGLEMILPESLRKDLEPFVKNELGKILEVPVKAEFSKKIAGGFTIGPKDGSYFVSFTDETFNALISEYLRPATRNLLFG